MKISFELPRPFHPKLSGISFKHPTRCLAAAAHFLIRKELFNSKYPQLQVAKDFAVAEKKLHLATSGRKYDPGKKAPKKRRTSNGKTAAPKPSTSQDQPQSESVSEQQPQSKTERSRNLDRSFRNIYIIPSFPTREQHAHSVQNARLRFNKLNQ